MKNLNWSKNLSFHCHNCRSSRGSHTFSNEPNFFKNEKVVGEKGSQWGVLAHEGGVTPLFDVASMENENWRMGLQACTRENNVSSQQRVSIATSLHSNLSSQQR